MNMAFDKKFGRRDFKEKSITCPCGSPAKLSSTKNYPHGKKSKVVISQFYRCLSCKKITFPRKDIELKR